MSVRLEFVAEGARVGHHAGVEAFSGLAVDVVVRLHGAEQPEDELISEAPASPLSNKKSVQTIAARTLQACYR